MTEFSLIEAFFKKRASQRDDVLLGIGDDAAAIMPPVGQVITLSTDTLNEGTHFLAAHTANAIGHRAMAVNLSDMAAMGAQPAWAMLALSLPQIDTQWLSAFCDGFFSLLDEYQLSLIGGDLTKGPLSINVTILGVAPASQLLKRQGAQVGDRIYVTGTLGRASYALNDVAKPLSERLARVTPRVKEGMSLRQIASAMIDISDGLAQDLSHILHQSRVGAELIVEKLPLDITLKKNVSANMAWQMALTGGDDYELCFTVPPDKVAQLEAISDSWTCELTCIGEIIAQPALRCFKNDGELISFARLGYQHFDND